MDSVVLEPRKPNANRRSQRVLLSIGIIISGTRHDGVRFEEETATSNVNAHGALILLSYRVEIGQLLTMSNVKTGEQLPCTVIDVTDEDRGKMEVGIEFLKPSPRFWRVSFPPDDWSPRSPEAKKYSGPPTSLPKKASSR